jgi:hypothetical protein
MLDQDGVDCSSRLQIPAAWLSSLLRVYSTFQPRSQIHDQRRERVHLVCHLSCTAEDADRAVLLILAMLRKLLHPSQRQRSVTRFFLPPVNR